MQLNKSQGLKGEVIKEDHTLNNPDTLYDRCILKY